MNKNGDGDTATISTGGGTGCVTPGGGTGCIDEGALDAHPGGGGIYPNSDGITPIDTII